MTQLAQAQTFCRDVERRIEIRQHIGWLKIYLGCMTERDWKDMRDRGLKQLDELSAAINGERLLEPKGDK